jgi:hypothetical protein
MGLTSFPESKQVLRKSHWDRPARAEPEMVQCTIFSLTFASHHGSKLAIALAQDSLGACVSKS